MHSTPPGKKSAKESWDAVKTMHPGIDCVKEANAQRLLKEFESITFIDGEEVDDFVIRISDLATNLRALRETSVDDARVVKK